MSESSFRMVDVGGKIPTVRRAQAQGRIELTEAAMNALVRKQNPKGDVLALAETAGIMAAKNVAQLLPLCHPLPIEQVRVYFEIEESRHSVLAFCEVSVTAKTGAEMEALAGVNGALLCVYDLSKAVDPVLKITDIRLNSKTGGKSGEWLHPDYETKAIGTDTKVSSVADAKKALPLLNRSAAVLTISDRVAAKTAEDRSGPLLADLLREAGASLTEQLVVPDERDQIAAQFRRLAFESTSDFIVSTGGTGLSPRDVTPEALESVCERMIPGLGEALRADGAKHIPTAWLSRSTAGMLNGRILIALPGSPKAVREGLAVLIPLFPHILHTLRGGDHAVR